jgi:hypothetical protein
LVFDHTLRPKSHKAENKKARIKNVFFLLAI